MKLLVWLASVRALRAAAYTRNSAPTLSVGRREGHAREADEKQARTESSVVQAIPPAAQIAKEV